MRTTRLTAGVATLAGVLSGLTVPPQAQAAMGWELNGPYSVVSNGEWSRTNEVFMDEKMVIATWTFHSNCTDAHTCTGTVTSDQGWSAPLEFRTTRWIVDLYHDNWEPCPDGSFSPGRQRFQFQGTDANGQVDKSNVSTLQGYDRTIGISGACGKNQPLVIQMPLTLHKL
ncbi:MAG: hypothetical protein HYZ39_24055 [Mycolicibacterium cosmeticum]|nr:hypothetical protein [Mycolicibacterium cosmeticum]